MQRLSTSFGSAWSPASFSTGPTPPSPGPTLFRVATTAVALVSRSVPKLATSVVAKRNTATHSTR